MMIKHNILFSFLLSFIILVNPIIGLAQVEAPKTEAAPPPVEESVMTIPEYEASSNEVDEETELLTEEEKATEQAIIEQAKATETTSNQKNISPSTWSEWIKNKEYKYDENTKQSIEKKLRNKSTIDKTGEASESKEYLPQQIKLPSFGISSEVGIVFLYILIALVLLFIIYFLVGNKYLSKENYKKETGKNEESWANIETFTEWDKAVVEAEQRGDYRLATHILFLETIAHLKSKGYINYKVNSTNHDLIKQIGDQHLRTNFKKICFNYEFVWFGKYELNQEQYHQLKYSFKQYNLFSA
jgi:hypothetical protein